MEVDKSKRLQEREREAEIYRKGARCLGLYTEILSYDLPQVSTN
jgi:hypothetical protein